MDECKPLECGAAADTEFLVKLGRAVQVDSIKTRVESAYGVCNQRLKVRYHKLLSAFAFNFNMRRYSWVRRLKESPLRW